MAAYNTKMFESIRDALTKNDNKIGERLKDFLRPEVGNTYVVRLLPNITDPSKTFFHYYNFGWKSFLDGKNINVTSLQTWEQPDPIAEERYRVYNVGTEAEKAKIKAIRRSENWMVNVFVVSDSKSPENNGKVKVLRFGKQLGKIIFDAIEGEGAEDFGPRVFDMGADGCSLMIKVEKQGDYPTYVSSKFKMPKALEDMPPEKIENVYKSTLDLTTYVVSKSYDELVRLLNDTYHCTNPDYDVKDSKEPAVTVVTATAKSVAPTALTEEDNDKVIQDLLNELT